jgi:CheY-like chemotaxis protein
MTTDVLVIDDEAGIRELLTRLTAGEGAACQAVATAEEGLELLRAGQRYRLLLVDYMLEGMDGIEFLEAARLLDPGAMRVLFTGDARARIAQEATLRARVNYFLVKPVGPEVIRQILAEVLPSEPREGEAPLTAAPTPGKAVQAYQRQVREAKLQSVLAEVLNSRLR